MRSEKSSATWGNRTPIRVLVAGLLATAVFSGCSSARFSEASYQDEARPAGLTRDRAPDRRYEWAAPAPPHHPQRPAAYQPALAQSQNRHAAPSSNGRIITVMPGDTLFSISRRYGVTVQALAAENRLGTPRIEAGQQLRLPLR